MLADGYKRFFSALWAVSPRPIDTETEKYVESLREPFAFRWAIGINLS